MGLYLETQTRLVGDEIDKFLLEEIEALFWYMRQHDSSDKIAYQKLQSIRIEWHKKRRES